MSLIHAFAALCIVLACAPVAQAQDAVIGLLALPQLFGNHTCDRFVPEQIRLYTAPDSGSLVGSIRVDSNWTFADNGGCEGLQVSVHAAATGLRSELPTREFGYEEPGAIVVDRHADWFRIKMHDGTRGSMLRRRRNIIRSNGCSPNPLPTSPTRSTRFALFRPAASSTRKH